MKLIRFRYDNKVFKGALEGEDVVFTPPGISFKGVKLQDVSLLAPVEPSKIVLVGLNYKDHARELGMELPEEPVIFIKPSTAVIGPGDDVIYPPGIKRLDYEAELAVVIKTMTRNISEKDVHEHVAGYTCLNDITARDVQKKDGQWTRSKSFDTFAPIGPWVETDINTSDIYVRSYVNGELKQSSRTSELIFNVPQLVAFVSRIMTLLPGDIVSTGTPSNVGALQPGDEVTVEIEGIGALKNRVALA